MVVDEVYSGMAVIFAENPDGTAQNDPVNCMTSRSFLMPCLTEASFAFVDAWEDLCPTYDSLPPSDE